VWSLKQHYTLLLPKIVDFVFFIKAKDGSFGFDFGGVYDDVRLNEGIAYTLEDGRSYDHF
jgi:hypothetical protein